MTFQKQISGALIVWSILATCGIGSCHARGYAHALAPLHLEAEAPYVPLDAATQSAARALREVLPSLEAGDPARAQAALDRARSIARIDDYRDLLQARIQLARGEREAARELAQRSAVLYGDSPLRAEFLEICGDIHEHNGNDTDARVTWQRAIEASPNPEKKAALWLRIGVSQERGENLDSAMDAYRRAGTQFPVSEAGVQAEERLQELAIRLDRPARSPSMLLELGKQLSTKGRNDAARIAFEAALAGELVKAERAEAEMALGRTLFRLRRYDEAATHFATQKPDREARYWWARSEARRGQVTRAVGELESLAKRSGPILSSRSLLVAALLLESRGEDKHSKILLSRVAENRRAPEQASVALWHLGFANYRARHYRTARREFLEMAKDLSDPLDRLRPRYWAARAAGKRGAEELAQKELTAIATEYPFSYYGWRATQHLNPPLQTHRIQKTDIRNLGKQALGPDLLHRIAVLLEAGFGDWAKDELTRVAYRARGVDDRVALGSLYVLAGDYHAAQRLIVDAYAGLLAGGVREDRLILWQLAWPMAYASTISDVFPPDAVIEPELVWAIMREESGYRPQVVSSAGARGLLQIMPETGARLAQQLAMDSFRPDDLFLPRVNLGLGAAYLDQLWRRFGGRSSAAIASYNAGPEAVARWLKDSAGLDDDVFVESIPYSQTRSYIKRVLRSIHVYRTFY